ncbi:hypothetical protein NDU88_003860 [Pleurodeles waltl]|uniref:Uncharacterized protein n=1 Tax=Pleurodeles waltl TaxID=8319 RepID=A0AAV7KL47_PLEWA|nr:hypothetical protein NDU88_000158 [Pleurodeles waltl]KAJ1098713.1 hypothetical protein NDU88_003820 [Pleurodeles waltl]KAJ1098753.1 hypothetical protein NDU88_003860 [Pleurodeles waltl]
MGAVPGLHLPSVVRGVRVLPGSSHQQERFPKSRSHYCPFCAKANFCEGEGARWCRRSGEARKPRPPEPSTKPLLPPPSLRNAMLQQRGFPLSEEPSRCRLDKGLLLLPRWRTRGRGGSWLFGLLGDRRDAIRRGQHSALSRLNRVQSKDSELPRVLLR